MLEKLQAKRAVLVAQRDQIIANYNLTSGAIAIIDELIGETMAEASKALSEQAEAILKEPTGGSDEPSTLTFAVEGRPVSEAA